LEHITNKLTSKISPTFQKCRIILMIVSHLSIYSTKICAQISDNFGDGNFTDNPTWFGDASSFKVNTAGELQLNAPDAGVAKIGVSTTIADSVIWKMDFRLEFATSTSNKVRIWLQADNQDFTVANGYFLEIGENGSVDALKFYRSDAGVSTLLIGGVSGSLGGDPVAGFIQVKRSAIGFWTADLKTPNGSLTPQFSISDNTYLGGNDLNFGYICTFSATRKDKFFFDNISIQPDLPDTQAPTLVSANSLNANTLVLNFDEPLDAISAGILDNYLLNGTTKPITATLNAITQSTVTLTFATPFPNGNNYTIQSKNIADLIGNISAVHVVFFDFFAAETPSEYDVLINEFMSDPTPSIGLPEVEWIEIYNASDKFLDLKDLFLADATSGPLPMPTFILTPKSYTVLCGTSSISTLSAYQNVIGIPNFPSINNDGDALQLTDAQGNTIDRVDFLSDWHTDVIKRAGGWSLERKNPLTPCLGAENWNSSNNAIGGTPSLENSILSNVFDQTAPTVLSVFPLNETQLKVVFSENLVKTVLNETFFTLTPTLPVDGVSFVSGRRDQVILSLSAPLTPSILYEISMSSEVQDCAGNSVKTDNIPSTGLAEKPAPNDIVFNELLFNPSTGGARYIEFYNNSTKIFNWADFSIANYTDSTYRAEKIVAEKLFLPNTYAVFSTIRSDILTRFEVKNPQWLYQNLLPSINDDNGNLALFWTKQQDRVDVDSIYYDKYYHNALISGFEREGTAIERVRLNQPSQAKTNWTTAATIQGKGRGTPTYKNSQTLDSLSQGGTSYFTLINTRLSPDDDGLEDFLEISYTLPNDGFFATLTVYDSDGVPIKKLVKQSLIGTSGTIRWDGDADNGAKPRPGIYIALIEAFTNDGTTYKEKKVFAVVF
jgi:Lamin Tail Domain/Bacterial Ig-like domain